MRILAGRGLRHPRHGKTAKRGVGRPDPVAFFVTLDGSVGGESGKQYVVIGVLTGDAAGQIDRVILN